PILKQRGKRVRIQADKGAPMITALNIPLVTAKPPAVGPTPASTPTELYAQADSLIEILSPAMASDPNLGESLKKMSTDLKVAFRDQVILAISLPKLAEDSHKAALSALAAGMLAGSLDGLIVLAASNATPAPTPAPATPPVKISGDDIKKELD